MLIGLLIAFWPAGGDVVDDGAYIGVCGDAHCDPLESESGTCPDDCPVEEEEPEPEPEEEEEETYEVDILDVDYVSYEDGEVTYDIILENIGDERAEDVLAEATLYIDDSKFDTCEKEPSISAGDAYDYTCTFDIESDVEDEESVELRLEVTVGDKSLTQTDTLEIDSDLADLVVADIDYDVEDNSTMEVTITILNDGAKDVDDLFTTDVDLYIEDVRHDSCSSSSTEIDDVEAGEEVTFSCDIDLDSDVAEDVLDGDLDIEIQVEVDDEDVIEEADEDNNEDTKTGDLEFSDFS